ncbi:hypothetical protein FFLO_04862 [Filobasidium floriforme]|uniref:Uncharacterized protein n=1 Tax=Filobasidium floriforme TaxID=5210 RepID=A0A8K0JHX6_9TREE|nr:uncharacterized protein HD553DRAFT_346459 [Filobasidium floriforme]KAG7530692.1 hypothetical protein FFLO_04862 [Filobasidium floriforme]KAH8077807.1 hypothetical protein HD553DRAFT_346459 [Filobasidium floriforme]
MFRQIHQVPEDMMRKPLKKSGDRPKYVARIDTHTRDGKDKDPLKSKHFCHLADIPPSPPVELVGEMHALQLSPTPQVRSPEARPSLSGRPRPPKLLIHRNSNASNTSSRSSNASSPLSQAHVSQQPCPPLTPDQTSSPRTMYFTTDSPPPLTPEPCPSPLPLQLQAQTQSKEESPRGLLSKRHLRQVVEGKEEQRRKGK